MYTYIYRCIYIFLLYYDYLYISESFHLTYILPLILLSILLKFNFNGCGKFQGMTIPQYLFGHVLLLYIYVFNFLLSELKLRQLCLLFSIFRT